MAKLARQRATELKIDLDPTLGAELQAAAAGLVWDELARGEYSRLVSGIYVPNPGPQTAFTETDCFEVLYGGAAGGGKSHGLMGISALRAANPRHSVILFRKTYVQIFGADGLFSKSQDMYPPLGFLWQAKHNQWWHPKSRSLIQFRYLQNANDFLNYQGLAYQTVAFDELPHFKEREYLYLFSRARSTDPNVRPRVRNTANPPGPGEPGEEWIKRRWAAWLDPEHPNPAASGEVRYYIRQGNDDVEVEPEHPDGKSRTFIAAKLSDNPFLTRDREYMTNLMLLPEADRMRLLDGMWDVKITARMYFKRENFKRLTRREYLAWCKRETPVIVRYWDRAATEVNPTLAPDPDWTVGIKIAKFRNGHHVILDIVRLRAGPDKVEAIIKLTAQKDKEENPFCITILEQDPGQAGKYEVASYRKSLRHLGIDVRFLPARDNKEKRAVTAVTEVNKGFVWYIDEPETVRPMKVFFDEVENFPLDAHDDQTDAFSGGMLTLNGHMPTRVEDYQV